MIADKLQVKVINGDKYEIGLHDGFAQVAFDVNHFLQPYMLRAQQSMAKMFAPEEIKEIQAIAQAHDGTPEGEAAASEKSQARTQEILIGKMSEQQTIDLLIQVLEGLPPKTMRDLMRALMSETLCSDGALRDDETANHHFRTRRKNIYPLAAEVIRVNGFFDMDISSLIGEA